MGYLLALFAYSMAGFNVYMSFHSTVPELGLAFATFCFGAGILLTAQSTSRK